MLSAPATAEHDLNAETGRGRQRTPNGRTKPFPTTPSTGRTLAPARRRTSSSLALTDQVGAFIDWQAAVTQIFLRRRLCTPRSADERWSSGVPEMPHRKDNVAASPPSQEDVPMTGAEDEPKQEEEEVYQPLDQRISICAGSSETAASFQFKNEDHTLGNALRYIIMKNPDVEFCGYSIPHPSEPLMNVRIQTYEGTTAIEALEKGFDDLMDLCDIVAENFMKSRQEFADRMEA
ncbi:hypothetical protein K3495_g141 [Podosphaera aphanis]|nr:hypothetical protein K3495_g141 [Podosphaera aphanis]